MRLQQLVKYRSTDDLPVGSFPIFSDHFATLAQKLRDSPPPQTVLGIVGLFPFRRSRRDPDSVSFVTFSSNRTTYAALRDVEDFFAEFYLSTGILPYVSPMPQSCYLRADAVPLAHTNNPLKTRSVSLWH